MEVTALVRYRQGVVGESQRVVHRVRVPQDQRPTQTMEALCGIAFLPGQAETLPEFTGMPCLACLAHDEDKPVELPIQKQKPLPVREPFDWRYDGLFRISGP